MRSYIFAAKYWSNMAVSDCDITDMHVLVQGKNIKVAKLKANLESYILHSHCSVYQSVRLLPSLRPAWCVYWGNKFLGPNWLLSSLLVLTQGLCEISCSVASSWDLKSPPAGITCTRFKCLCCGCLRLCKLLGLYVCVHECFPGEAHVNFPYH